MGGANILSKQILDHDCQSIFSMQDDKVGIISDSESGQSVSTTQWSQNTQLESIVCGFTISL